MQTDGEPPITVVEADGEPPVTVVEANGDEPPVTVVEVVAVEVLAPAGAVEVLATADAVPVEVLAPAGAVEVLGSSSEAVSAATSDACVCSECKKVHPQSSFSKTQWSKPVEQRRCKSCIGAGKWMLLDGTAVLLLPMLLVAIRREQNPIYRRPNVDSLLLLLAFLWKARMAASPHPMVLTVSVSGASPPAFAVDGREVGW
ncbi:hypothetical protein EMIHUDRAFT_205627 [Emiliania huxleyi CCMP1516]|uniref:Uncharacterized protein n=2 Tax=Emiliania huxleyi TaxID=2903 RepID=A0A0D3JSQ6_EMIH1|nr:hypothetical protein EMIHUDRAFT_205627 [Emiliania huxleyi CCMP1516]EOD26541.1 hypothetical protein EMIHUDRAFT_205627 [Emiliania huxleyi CCMP1516]|eukprot:XP_005778970.1 hypothetical protein EMIHUDRAFT_205627 [Emiliania huxleyi CCMP1516]